MFAISKSPQGSTSAAPQRREAGCHFYELSAPERREDDATTGKKPTIGVLSPRAGRGERGRDCPHLGRCASVSLHIRSRLNHPADVERQGWPGEHTEKRAQPEQQTDLRRRIGAT